MIYELTGKRVWVAGHKGMVGAALIRRLGAEGCQIVTTEGRSVDFRRQADVESFMPEARPHAVIVAAAKVGGILANDTYPADFLYDNLMIEANIIAAAKEGIRKLLPWVICIAKMAPQPITEDALLTGSLEPSNQWYAIAKIAGVKAFKLTDNSMVAILSRRCRQIFMARGTILICSAVMFCQR